MGVLTADSGPWLAGANPEAIIVDPSNRFAYVTNVGGGNVSAYTIDGATGTLTSIPFSPYLVGGTPYAAAVDPSGSFLYITSESAPYSVSAFAINPSSG